MELIPNAKKHYQNHLSWINLISRIENPSKLKGIILTGRSRYDHMQSVCELLPASIPSLVLSLQTIVNYDQSETNIFQDAKQFTECNYPRTLTGFLLDVNILMKQEEIGDNLTALNDLYKCKFPASDLYNWILNLKLTTLYFETKHSKYLSILNNFNLKYKHFNTIIYDYVVKTFYPNIKARFKNLLETGEKNFDKYFYGDLYEELTNVYILRHIETIDQRQAELNKTIKPEFALVRPFNKIEQTLIMN